MSNIQYIDQLMLQKKAKTKSLEPEQRYIIWEKFRDPFGEDVVDQEFPGAFVTASDIANYNEKRKKHTFLEEEYEDDFQNEPDLQLPPLKNNGVIATPMGMIPITEYTNPCKVFNFWTMHTNFSLMTNEIREILDSIPGIETVDIFTRYRARLSFGKVFSETNMKLLVMKTLKATTPNKSE